MNLEPLNFPEGFIGIIDNHVIYSHTVHLAEELGTIDYAVGHFHVIAVPYCRARAHREVATGYFRAIYVPQGIFPFKVAVVALNVVALF